MDLNESVFQHLSEKVVTTNLAGQKQKNAQKNWVTIKSFSSIHVVRTILALYKK